MEPKHIEVQILADNTAMSYHIGERDCPPPAPLSESGGVRPRLERVQGDHRRLCMRTPSKIAKSVGYVSAYTVEFLVDKDGHHYFIEMNPRIQVEHTVSERSPALIWCALSCWWPRAILSPPRRSA